jgi:hypothetical protein
VSEPHQAWTSQQVQENLSVAHENLPEARTTDRFPVSSTASGMDFPAGEQPDKQDTTAQSGSGVRMPPDPPRGLRAEGGR